MASDDGPTVDRILENLQKRPSVRATLILSRRDGSIIRVSGADFRIGADSGASIRHQADSDAAIQLDDEVPAKEVRPTRLQTLAGCIFAHVASAEALGDALQDSKSSDITGTASSEIKHGHDEQSKRSQHDEDVQLLRLRFRKQEIIIFPDPNYLNCVVQDIEKSGR